MAKLLCLKVLVAPVVAIVLKLVGGGDARLALLIDALLAQIVRAGVELS